MLPLTLMLKKHCLHLSCSGFQHGSKGQTGIQFLALGPFLYTGGFLHFAPCFELILACPHAKMLCKNTKITVFTFVAINGFTYDDTVAGWTPSYRNRRKERSRVSGHAWDQRSRFTIISCDGHSTLLQPVMIFSACIQHVNEVYHSHAASRLPT